MSVEPTQKQILAIAGNWSRMLDFSIDNPRYREMSIKGLRVEIGEFIDAVNEANGKEPETHREDLQAMCRDWIADNFDEAMKYYRDGVSDAEEDLAEGTPNWRGKEPKAGGVFGNEQLHVDAYDRGYAWGLQHATVASRVQTTVALSRIANGNKLKRTNRHDRSKRR